jgi:hypothetical protein
MIVPSEAAATKTIDAKVNRRVPRTLILCALVT